MSEKEKIKLIKSDVVTKPKITYPSPAAKSHSQDADRHRKIKHPVSDK